MRQMDTHETEEDREKKRKLDEGKEGKMTKPNDDMAHLKRDIMEALKRSDEKMDSYSRKPMKKWNAIQERLMKNTESYSWFQDSYRTCHPAWSHGHPTRADGHCIKQVRRELEDGQCQCEPTWPRSETRKWCGSALLWYMPDRRLAVHEKGVAIGVKFERHVQERPVPD